MSATTVPATHDAPSGVEAAVGELLTILRARGRSDLVDRTIAAGARLERPSTIVCVVGEFKQGKSSLINGLLGQDVCPVDDDLATSAITLVRHGQQAQAVVRRREGEETIAAPIAVEELAEWVSESGNPGNHRQVERVDITSPSPMLREGLVLVDTPGMGGLGAGHAAATLSFLPFADGLILVSDAGAELTAPEMELLQHATELCPTVMFAQTKIDLHPSWQRILELNRGHLERRGIHIPVVAVSSTVRHEALARQDRSLNDASRFPELIDALTHQIIAPARETAAARSADDVRAIAGLVRTGLEEERRLLTDPASLPRAMADLTAANEQLQRLRGPGARWNVVLGDRVAALSNDTMHTFRAGIRAITKEMDERIEELRTGAQWDEMVRDLQGLVAAEVTTAFVAIEQGRIDIHDEITALLQDDRAAIPPGIADRMDPIDLARIWDGKPIEDRGRPGKRAFTTALTGLRGAQGGVIMFGILPQLLPAAIAPLFAANPVVLGAAALLGGFQLSEDRKRRIAQRRSAARQQVRQFADSVQFEVSNAITSLIRDIQRDLRETFSQRIAELQQTYAETARSAQEDARRSQVETKQRIAELEAGIVQLARVASMIAGAGDG